MNTLMLNPLNESIFSVFDNKLRYIHSTISLSQLLASFSGTKSGQVSLILDVSSDTVIDWGDGSSTNVLASNGEFEYTHSYSAADDPEITIQEPEYVTKMTINLTGFVLNFSGYIKNSVFSSLLVFTNITVPPEDWIGNPFDTLQGVTINM